MIGYVKGFLLDVVAVVIWGILLVELMLSEKTRGKEILILIAYLILTAILIYII